MSVESQKLLEILQYICFAGLILSGLAALIIADHRRKAVSLFVILVFITILSFVFYGGIMLFITNIIFIFVFALFYILVRRIAFMDIIKDRQKKKRNISLNIIGYAMAVLFCSGLGYFVFEATRGYFSGNQEPRDLIITNMKDITGSLFGSYSVVIIILAAAAFMTFVSFTSSVKRRKEDREVQK